MDVGSIWEQRAFLRSCNSGQEGRRISQRPLPWGHLIDQRRSAALGTMSGT